jgi:hypothetical protein
MLIIYPFLFSLLTFTPGERRIDKVFMFPLFAAMCNGESLLIIEKDSIAYLEM